DVERAAIPERIEDLIFQLLVLFRVVKIEQKLDCLVSAATRDCADGRFAKFDNVRATRDLEQFGAGAFASAISKAVNHSAADFSTLIRVVDPEQCINCRFAGTSGNTQDREFSLTGVLAADGDVTQDCDRARAGVSAQSVERRFDNVVLL